MSFLFPNHHMVDKGCRANSPPLMISGQAHLRPHQQDQHYYGTQVRCRAHSPECCTQQGVSDKGRASLP